MKTDEIKAITICQPYAHLIVTPQEELPAGETRKRVENRKWTTQYRGLLAIHAGKSRSWLSHGDEKKFPEMKFGAIVGVASLVACPSIEQIRSGEWAKSRLSGRKYDWLQTHEHAEGPFCWILEDVTRIDPIPCHGKQGLWAVSEDLAVNIFSNLLTDTEGNLNGWQGTERYGRLGGSNATDSRRSRCSSRI